MKESKYKACKAQVANRGVAPDSFLDELVAWARSAPEEIFAVNTHVDVYSSVRPELGPWIDLAYRRAVMCDVLRVLAGFESSWNWEEGVDVTNHTSMTHIEGQETGIFQVSFDSTVFDASLRTCARHYCSGYLSPQDFIPAMKTQHVFALEYAARLLRITVKHNGPVLRKEINPWLRREAVAEFETLLKQEEPTRRLSAAATGGGKA